MKVSIIVPIYNVEKYIRRCLESVAAQTYPEIECVLVNDCTPDNSAELAKSFISAYTGDVEFKLINHSNNKGLSAARNSGISASVGQYVFFLDSDDAIPANAISTLVSKAEENSFPEIVRYIRKYMPEFQRKWFNLKIVLPAVLIAIVAYVSTAYVGSLMGSRFITFITTLATSTALIAIMAYFGLLDEGARHYCKGIIKRII